jgi:hypothetical protein
MYRSMLKGACGVLAVWFACFGFAKASEQSAIVPVEKAAFHLLAFSNELVSLQHVTIPAGRTVPYHRHEQDLLVVVLEPANTQNQVLGQSPVDRVATRGAVTFAAYTKKPGVHQLINTDTKPYHLLGVAIAYPEPGRFTASTREDVAAYKTVLNNERVRAWWLVLEPGQGIPAITQQAPGGRIVVGGGELIENEPGNPDRPLLLKMGDFMWQPGAATRELRNTGSTQIEFVEFELK